jgi:hypothetical protein
LKNKKLHHFFALSNALEVIEVSGPWFYLRWVLTFKTLDSLGITPTLRDPDFSRDEMSIMFKSNQKTQKFCGFYQCWVVFIE